MFAIRGEKLVFGEDLGRLGSFFWASRRARFTRAPSRCPLQPRRFHAFGVSASARPLPSLSLRGASVAWCGVASKAREARARAGVGAACGAGWCAAHCKWASTKTPQHATAKRQPKGCFFCRLAQKRLKNKKNIKSFLFLKKVRIFADALESLCTYISIKMGLNWREMNKFSRF